MTKVKDIMTKNVITCGIETSVKEAARLMYLNGLTGLPVLDKADKLVGIITDTDLIKVEGKLHLPVTFAFLGSLVYLDNPLNGDEIQKQFAKLVATKVGELMSKEAVTISSEAVLEDVAELFLHKKINPIPVVDEGRLVGIISRADVVKLIAGERELLQDGWKDLVKRS